MTLPEKGWRGYGAPNHPYSLRPALILANEAEFDLREVSFRAWRIRAPQEADAVLLMLETILIPLRTLTPKGGQ